MKSIIALTVLLFSCFFGQAQATTENISLTKETVKVETIQIIDTNNITLPTITTESKIEVARLYKNKNNRVIKALKFSTKANKPKIA